jgi:SRSO17 transposase
VAVSLSIANHAASLPVAYRLYLPEAWAADPERRRKAGVPEDVDFATKPAIALEQIRAAVADGIPRGTVLMDAGYGLHAGLRAAITALGLGYIAGIQPNTTVWPAGDPPTRSRRKMRQAKALALGLPAAAWARVTWREGSADWLSSRVMPACGCGPRIPVVARRGRRNGCWWNGPRTRPSRRDTGSPACPRTCRWKRWSILPSCAGGSSATIRS